jgi:hypothetical protein
MGLNMPEGESSDNKSGIDVDRAEKMHGQFPNDGAKKPKRVSKRMKAHMKRGLVSEKALHKASGKGA